MIEKWIRKNHNVKQASFALFNFYSLQLFFSELIYDWIYTTVQNLIFLFWEHLINDMGLEMIKHVVAIISKML